MQRNYPRMFSPADDKDGFKLLKHVKAWLISYSRLPAKLKLPIFKIDVF